MLKQLSSFMALSVNGGDRISYTYDEINDETGDVIDTNKKESFFIVDEELRDSINDVRDWIRRHKLSE